MTSAAPSPPVENVSAIQQGKPLPIHNEANNGKSLVIECDFTQIDEENYKHEDILILERFKEAIELLIIKVSESMRLNNRSEPPLPLQNRGFLVPQEFHRFVLFPELDSDQQPPQEDPSGSNGLYNELIGFPTRQGRGRSSEQLRYRKRSPEGQTRFPILKPSVARISFYRQLYFHREYLNL